MVAAGNDIDFTETMRRNFGLKGWYFGMFVFVAMLTIPIILYLQLLAQMLFPILTAVIFYYSSDNNNQPGGHA